MSTEDHLWCTRCNRTYLARDCRRGHQRAMCAYDGCNGMRVLAVAWPLLCSFNPSLPAQPTPGVVYPYGAGQDEAAALRVRAD